MITPIASWPAMRSLMVANVPMRGAVKVIVVTTIAPMTPPIQSQAARARSGRGFRPPGVRPKDGADDERGRDRPERGRLEHADPLAEAPLTATWIGRRGPRRARERPPGRRGHGGEDTPSLGTRGPR